MTCQNVDACLEQRGVTESLHRFGPRNSNNFPLLFVNLLPDLLIVILKLSFKIKNSGHYCSLASDLEGKLLLFDFGNE